MKLNNKFLKNQARNLIKSPKYQLDYHYNLLGHIRMLIGITAHPERVSVRETKTDKPVLEIIDDQVLKTLA